jgi:hypothetical protein
MIDYNSIFFILLGVFIVGTIVWFITRLQWRHTLERADQELQRLNLMASQVRQDLDREKDNAFTLQQELTLERRTVGILEEKTSRLEKI